uniref:WSC domain-containing protein n=1 Tax=Kwoniella pini CBS 10737 TaxID=1296096 RepID=A0A1B9HUV3_9TREE|nr:uncharacterized protein I206_06812 [Kwoniella pini CBS 10737]OCF47038.1 hypothetical protein I206_06812 [Kwoniella pini CBS 10737]
MRVEALIPVIAFMAAQGASAAPVVQNQENLDKRWCLLGLIGTSCGSSNAVTSSAAVSSAVKTSTSVVASSSAKASIASSVTASSAKASVASSVSASKAPTTVITTAAATSTASWSSCKDFDWTTWTGYSWGGFSVDYVKAWYLDTYGLHPPPNMDWNQVSSLVSKFGQKTTASGAKATSVYQHGCSNPWTATASQATSTAKVTTTAAASASTSKAASSAPLSSASAAASKSSATSVVSSVASASASASKSSVASSAAVVSSSASASTAASSAPAASSAAVSVAPVVSSASASASTAASSAPAASSASVSVAPVVSSASPSIASVVSSAVVSSSVSPMASPASSSVSSVASPAASSVASPAVSSAASAVASPASSSSVADSAASASASASSSADAGTATAGPGTGSGSATATGSASPSATSSVSYNGFTAGGCVQEVSGRLLAKVQTSSSNMTIEQCTSLCGNYGYAVAGVEYGDECYCGTQDDIANALVSGQCVMPCAGDSTEICGGPNALNIFINPDLQPATINLPTGWTTYGVVAEGTTGRALTYTLWSDPSNTIESCANGCAALGYTISGTEYSSECYCGNSFSNGGGALQDSSAAFMACSGNLAEMCGGPSLLSVVTSISGTIPSS